MIKGLQSEGDDQNEHGSMVPACPGWCSEPAALQFPSFCLATEKEKGIEEGVDVQNKPLAESWITATTIRGQNKYPFAQQDIDHPCVKFQGLVSQKHS